MTGVMLGLSVVSHHPTSLASRPQAFGDNAMPSVEAPMGHQAAEGHIETTGGLCPVGAGSCVWRFLQPTNGGPDLGPTIPNRQGPSAPGKWKL